MSLSRGLCADLGVLGVLCGLALFGALFRVAKQLLPLAEGVCVLGLVVGAERNKQVVRPNEASLSEDVVRLLGERSDIEFALVNKGNYAVVLGELPLTALGDVIRVQRAVATAMPENGHPVGGLEAHTAFKLLEFLLHAISFLLAAADMYCGNSKSSPHTSIISRLRNNVNSAIIEVMNILYCGDRGISQGVLVSILSLLMRGRQIDGLEELLFGEMTEAVELVELKFKDPVYHIYIMTVDCEGVEPFPRKSAEFLDRLVKGKVKGVPGNAKSFVKLVDATEVFLGDLPKKNMGTYFTPCAMLRLYMDRVPELSKLKRILYLDYDVVCRGNISEFYDMDLIRVEAAGVLDIYGRRWYKYHGLRKRDAMDWADVRDRPWSFLKQDYMNSGVMLFNLEECRKTGCLERAREICMTKKMLLPDQGALNRAISRRRLVARRFNEQEERPREDTALHHFSNNFKFWPYFRVQKVKPFEIAKVHQVLKIHEYDDILDQFDKLKNEL